MAFQTGSEVFIGEKKWKGHLEGLNVAVLSHPASVDQNLNHVLDLILNNSPLKVSCLLGPQHGFKGVEQANMIPTKDESIAHGFQSSSLSGSPFQTSALLRGKQGEKKITGGRKSLPVFSLYSEKTRRLNTQMLSCFDALIMDLQDVGIRVYTYLTTLFYIMEDLSGKGKALWVLDRPNPVGRGTEGFILEPEFFSFVGAAPLPLRHGMTLGELALWYRDLKKLNLDLKVIKMKDYFPAVRPWPKSLVWTLPSPNMVDVECARIYGGTVLLEGTFVSEARGTVFPLKAFGFPGMKAGPVLEKMHTLCPRWLKGCRLRVEFFKPVFDKFKNQRCEALRIYAQKPFYSEKDFFPFRLVSLFLKCVKLVHPDFQWQKPPPYEYEYEKPPVDILSGSTFLREWIEAPSSAPRDMESQLLKHKSLWHKQRKPYLLY